MTKEKETLRLYDNNAYATNFSAVVLSCEPIQKEEGIRYQVVVNQTLFFPEEGGQSPDKGTMNGIDVIDVQIKNGVITHTLMDAVEVGETIEGMIDWTHRFNNMQQHSGEHIFSGIVHRRFGYKNVGFHLSDQIVTMDFDGGLSRDEIEEVEYEVNQVIAKNVEILVTYPSKDELENLVYRSKIDIEGQVRIVTVLGYDVCACCAPHVRRTGEIGMLKVMSVQNYKGGVRISMLCGFRALLAYRKKMQIIDDLTGLLTCGQEQLLDNVTKQKSINQSLKSQLVSAKQELMGYRLAEIPKEQKNVILFEKGMDANVMRTAVNRLIEGHKGICAVFNGDETEGYQYIIGSKTIDCKSIASALREQYGAKGGGSVQMIQGCVQGQRENLEKTLSVLS